VTYRAVLAVESLGGVRTNHAVCWKPFRPLIMLD
jgi:hypothetical protein